MSASSSTTVDQVSIAADENAYAGDMDNELGKRMSYHDRLTWRMAPEVQMMRERDEQGGEKPRKLGVSWTNLTVKGIGADANFNENVISQLYPFHKSNITEPMKTIIENSSGCVKPGEMLLVLTSSRGVERWLCNFRIWAFEHHTWSCVHGTHRRLQRISASGNRPW